MDYSPMPPRVSLADCEATVGQFARTAENGVVPVDGLEVVFRCDGSAFHGYVKPPRVLKPVDAVADAGKGPNKNVSHRCLGEILELLGRAGHRMTGEELIDALDDAGKRNSDSVVWATLSYYTHESRRVLTNCQSCDPKGYGLPFWE